VRDIHKSQAVFHAISKKWFNGKLALAKGRLLNKQAGKAVHCNKPVYDYQI
jgi:hypothetical protein